MASSSGPVDQAWIDAAVERFEKPLTLYATRLIGELERARDVVQDTFLKLCTQDRPSVEPHLAEWLFTVCRNRALDVLRKEGPMTQLSNEQLGSRSTSDPGPLESIERREAAARVLELIDALPPNQREVIRLKFQNGFSYKEISRISGHSVSNVGFLIHVGMKTLKTRMGVLPVSTSPAVQH